jgi:hypothetical protein
MHAGGHEGVIMRQGWACILLLAADALHAQSFSVGGSVSGLIGDGLQLELGYTQCLADNQSFMLTTGEPGECFASPNITRCCSQQIKSAVFDGISTVTCTCGTVPIRPNIVDDGGGAGAEIVNVPKNAASYAFGAPVPAQSSFGVFVNIQPNHPVETCLVQNPYGVVTGGNVTGVNVVCSDRIFANGFN